MALNWPPKSPGETLDYSFDWSQALAGDTITGSSWALSDSSLVDDHDSFTSTSTTVWLKGGTNNANYSLTNTITTAGGRIFDQVALLLIRNT